MMDTIFDVVHDITLDKGEVSQTMELSLRLCYSYRNSRHHERNLHAAMTIEA